MEMCKTYFGIEAQKQDTHVHQPIEVEKTL